MKVLFVATIATLILLAGIRLGIRAGLDMAEKQAENAYIEQYILDHQQGD